MIATTENCLMPGSNTKGHCRNPLLKIHWICPELTPYHAAFFHELSSDARVSLQVHFLKKSSPVHPWKQRPLTPFCHRFVKSRFGVDPHLFRLAVDKTNKFFVSGWNTPFLILFMLWLIILRREFLFAADVPNPNKLRSVLKRIVRRAISAMVFNRSRKVLAMGSLGRQAFEALGCPPEKIVSFPYFTPITDYDPSLKAVSPRDPLIIVSIGRISNNAKGFDIGLRAFERFKRSGKRMPFRYLICGTGPDLQQLQNQARELGLSEELEFLGWLESAQVTSVLQRAHIMLHPANWEPYGVVILEAMVNGVVVLGSEGTCAARDRIIHGRNGFLHPVGSVDTIVEQLEFLFEHREALFAMGIEARRSAEEWPASRGVEILRRAFLDGSLSQ